MNGRSYHEMEQSYISQIYGCWKKYMTKNKANKKTETCKFENFKMKYKDILNDKNMKERFAATQFVFVYNLIDDNFSYVPKYDIKRTNEQQQSNDSVVSKKRSYHEQADVNDDQENKKPKVQSKI
jgi:hypothetical protein